MYPIHIKFKNLNEVTLYEVYGQIGVYVLWHGRSQIKPLRIGQGQILHRFASHVRNDSYYYPIYGVVGILGIETAKHILNAKIIESVLLHIAHKINRFPTDNSNMGEVSKVYRVLKKKNLTKIHIKGRDPLLKTSTLSNKPLSSTKIIEVWLNEEDKLDFRHPWHTRS
jgi:hypothetical protein